MMHIISMNGKVWVLGKSLGVLILSALCLPLLISSVLAEGNQTTTTTTTIQIPQIDVAPLINLVVALLPAIPVIVIIRAVLGSISSYARFTRFRHKLSGWFNAVSNSRVVRVLPAVLMIAFLCFGFISGVAADTGSTTSIDVSAMIDLVMSLLPLIIVLVIVKALMNAFKGL